MKLTKNKNNEDEKLVEIYSEKQAEKDEKSFEENLKNPKVNYNYNDFKRLFLRDIVINTNIISDDCIGGIKIENIREALKYPSTSWRTILSVSTELMKISPHYNKLCMTYSNMAMYCWGVDLYDVKEAAKLEAVKKSYNTLINKLEDMNLKSEFSKILRVLPYQDIYCGVIFEDNNDFFIQQINYGVCKLYEIQDGLYNFVIDLSKIKVKEIGGYPGFIQQAYLDFVDGKIESPYYKPEADKQICIKLNYQWQYPYPIFMGIIKDLLDLDTYKKLKLQSARTDNYKAIMIKVPIDETTIDKPLLSPDMLGLFAQINRDCMSDDIGILYTLGSTGEAVSFKDSNNTRNNVEDAVTDIYNSSGVTKELFNGSSSATAVSNSITNTSSIVYSVYRQLERWTNRFIKTRKYNKSNFKFKFYLLDITIFNRKDEIALLKDAVSFGAPVIDKYLSAIGMTPGAVFGSYILHQDVYKFYDNFKPLQTSYNSNTDTDTEKGGRPSNESQGKALGDTGEQTADSDGNKDR